MSVNVFMPSALGLGPLFLVTTNFSLEMRVTPFKKRLGFEWPPITKKGW